MKFLRYTMLLVISILVLLSHHLNGQNINTDQDVKYQYAKPEDGVVRILTYNVRNCLGMDGKTDCGRISAVILAINPEVIALQELDSVTTRSKGIDILKVIAGKCAMNYSYGASIPYQGGKYGIGILSKELPLRITFVPLPGREEKRGLLMAEFKDYLFFCSHFSLTEEDRVASVQLVNQKVTELHKRVFLAGDLNAKPESEAINTLSKNWISLSGKQPTFPSSGPKECIDYIWGINCCSFDYDIVKQVVVPEMVASDHRPVFIDVKLK